MSRMIFVNLPVADVQVSRAFYTALGFTINETFSDERTASAVVSETITVMLLQRDRFQEFLPEGRAVADAAAGTGFLLALSADSREEVDQLVSTALTSGGGPWRPTEGQGPMYGGSFTDPDGHVFEVVWMDPSAFGDQ